MNHCWGAHYLLQQFMAEEEMDIAIITEPVCIPISGNWMSSRDGKAALYWKGKNLRTHCKRVIQGQEFVAMKVYDTTIMACYVSPKYKVKEFKETLERMGREIDTMEIRNLVLGGDFNAHSKLWGSGHRSCKGKELEEWTDVNNLVLINEGREATCVRP